MEQIPFLYKKLLMQLVWLSIIGNSNNCCQYMKSLVIANAIAIAIAFISTQKLFTACPSLSNISRISTSILLYRKCKFIGKNSENVYTFYVVENF